MIYQIVYASIVMPSGGALSVNSETNIVILLYQIVPLVGVQFKEYILTNCGPNDDSPKCM